MFITYREFAQVQFARLPTKSTCIDLPNVYRLLNNAFKSGVQSDVDCKAMDLRLSTHAEPTNSRVHLYHQTVGAWKEAR